MYEYSYNGVMYEYSYNGVMYEYSFNGLNDRAFYQNTQLKGLNSVLYATQY